MSQTSPAVVLFIGECDSPQFRRAVPDGKSQVAACSAGDGDPAETVDVLALAQNHYATSIQDAISLMGSGELVPDLVVAYQSIPDEYPAAEIDQLIGMLPALPIRRCLQPVVRIDRADRTALAISVECACPVTLRREFDLNWNNWRPVNNRSRRRLPEMKHSGRWPLAVWPTSNNSDADCPRRCGRRTLRSGSVSKALLAPSA